MTAKELAQYIGKKGWITLGALRIYVKIEDVRAVYGKIQYQVRPVDEISEGTVWVESVKISPSEEAK